MLTLTLLDFVAWQRDTVDITADFNALEQMLPTSFTRMLSKRIQMLDKLAEIQSLRNTESFQFVYELVISPLTTSLRPLLRRVPSHNATNIATTPTTSGRFVGATK